MSYVYETFVWLTQGFQEWVDSLWNGTNVPKLTYERCWYCHIDLTEDTPYQFFGNGKYCMDCYDGTIKETFLTILDSLI